MTGLASLVSAAVCVFKFKCKEPSRAGLSLSLARLSFLHLSLSNFFLISTNAAAAAAAAAAAVVTLRGSGGGAGQ